ncbi:universal stress protein [Natrononativus amylolyticus]|uniref:universal stress protein n=1 Tax=Natrononativus amylolyticus TaxID=2963434 RepID=UPI0020CFCA06|nr:universal stress protein [Natrononativus amylolyticus]
MVDDTPETRGTLLVPLANPDTADRQLDTAIDIATDRSYRLVLVFVLEVPPQLSLADGRRYLLDSRHEELLQTAAERAAEAGILAERRIRMARGVARGIVGAAARYDADAILVGWRGRPPRGNVVLGSHVDTVLRDAECDVLVKRVQTPSPADPDSVLVPVAGGPHDECALEAAASIARSHDAGVHLLHVVAETNPEYTESEAEVLLGGTRSSLEGVATTTEVATAENVAGAITDRTADHDLTLLGVSRGGLLERRLLGSVSEGVGRHAAGTVILARRYVPTTSRLRRALSRRRPSGDR